MGLLTELELNESDANYKVVPVYLVAVDGTPYAGSLSGFTITYKKPGGTDDDRTSKLTAISAGRYALALDTAGDLTTAGIGWISITKTGVIQPFVEPVRIRTGVTTLTLAAIAAANWDLTSLSSHRAAGSFGELLQVIAGLLHVNARLDNLTYGDNAVMTAARLRVFASKAAADSASPGADDNSDSEIFRFTITATDAGDGEIGNYKFVRNL